MAKIAGDKSDIIKAVPMACADEDTAVEFLEDMRWEREPSCPRCGDVDVYMMKDRKTGERSSRYLWRCRGCARQFTVRIGTIMEDSRIPMRHWCFAFWAACSSKKGVSALQIKRQTGLTYKSALFLMHRVRYAMNGAANSGPLSGDVEHDATYVGGKIRPRTNRGKRRPRGYKRMDNKTPVIAVVERSGQARAEVTTNVTSANLAKHIRENVDPGAARLHTDEASQYVPIGREFAGGHHTVLHSQNEYARMDGDVLATTNTVEGFFALLKRGVMGTFHHVSKEHLHRYVSEFEFRWNTRHVDDGARIKTAIRGSEGKRLMYRHP